MKEQRCDCCCRKITKRNPLDAKEGEFRYCKICAEEFPDQKDREVIDRFIMFATN